MTCSKCNATYPGNAVFCIECGGKLSNQVVESVPTLASTLDEISTHLEFLGYSTEKVEAKEKGEKTIVFARHPKSNNIFFFETMAGFVLFKVLLNCVRQATPEMDKYINEANRVLDITKVYYEVEEGGNMVIKLETTYVGLYVKATFAQFMSMFERDQGRFSALDNFDSIFLEQ